MRTCLDLVQRTCHVLIAGSGLGSHMLNFRDMEAGGPGALWNTPNNPPVRRTGLSRVNAARRRLRRFVFTLNNYTEEELEAIKEFGRDKCRWMICAKETGEEQMTQHLQGGCLLISQTCFSTLKKSKGFERAHLENMYGKPEDTLSYCTKQDKEPFIVGELPQQGKRNDLREAVEFIQEGHTLQELAKNDIDGGVVIVKYYKGLSIYRSLVREPRLQPPKVFWLYGKTGTGKTRTAMAMADWYGDRTNDLWISSGTLRWFDGYDGQSVAIFDDFRPAHVPTFAFFLRLLDRYPVSVEIKGSFVFWTPKIIIITSPYSVDQSFPGGSLYESEDLAQLKRRISDEYCFEDTHDSERIALLRGHFDTVMSRDDGGGSVP